MADTESFSKGRYVREREDGNGGENGRKAIERSEIRKMYVETAAVERRIVAFSYLRSFAHRDASLSTDLRIDRIA